MEHPLLPRAQYANLTVDSPSARAALVETLRRVDAAGGLGWPDDKSLAFTPAQLADGIGRDGRLSQQRYD